MRVSMMFTLAAPLAVALAVAPALAHGPHGGGACRKDLHAYCSSLNPPPDNFHACLATLCGSDFKPGPGAFASCLQTAAGKGTIQLSQGCTTQLTGMQDKILAFQNKCGGAVTAYNCSGGPRSIGKCLRENQTALSQAFPDCAALLAQHHGHHHHHAPDWAPGSEPGNP